VSEISLTSADWAARITACWRTSVESILEVSRLLIAANETLPHGQWQAMCERDLPFKLRTAERLMAIARDERLSNPTQVSILPASWGTPYELTRLDDKQFEARLSDGTINPDMKRCDIATEIKQSRRAEREQELAAKQAALPTRKYGVIVADNEWRFEPRSRETGMDRAADNHYPTSALEEIKSRDVASIAADDCVLFLWATAPMLPEALSVMELGASSIGPATSG
jgi:hypothetical protein